MRKSKRITLASLLATGFVSHTNASMNVYLNFGPDFESEVNSVNAVCGQANYTDAQISAMESAVQQEIETLYSGYQITFSLTNSTGARVVNFSSSSGGTLYGETTEAPFGNYDTSANDYSTIFPQNFIRPLQVSSIDSNPSLYLADYERFLTNVTGHELGHSFGLQHWDSYGVPQITPANYANTTSIALGEGYQALDLIADLTSGKGDAAELSSQTTIGLWDRAKFDVTGGTADGGASIVNHPVLEISGSAGHTLAAATSLAFTTGETSGLQLSLRRTTLDSSGNDFYRFTTTSGGQFTSEVLSSTGIASKLGLAFHPKITLLASDGVTPIWSNDGLSYSGNLYDTPPTPNTSYVPISDPFLDNIPIPSAGTYFINVQAEGTFASGDLYQMLSGFNAGYVQPDTFVYQNAAGGNWNSSAAWKTPPSGSTSSMPADDSTAIAILGSGWVTPAVISNASIQFNQTYTSGLDELQIDSGNTLVQSSGTSTMVVNKIALGMDGPGGYNQSAGTNSVAQFITLGNNPGNIGTYALSGNAQLINTGNEYVGYNGTGTFTQTGGTHHLYGDLLIAANTGSSGTYNLEGGTLTIDPGSDGIILNTNGTFHQSGGTLTFPAFTQNGGTALFDNGLDLTAATYSLNGGSLTIPSSQNLTIENISGTTFTLNSPGATLTAGGLVTNSNPANFVWNAGTLQTTRAPLDFVSFPDPFGSNPFSNTPLILNSQKHLVVSDLEWLGDTGDSITQTTGSTNTCLSIYIGSTGTTPTYNLNDGTLTSTLLEIVGVVLPVGNTLYGGPGSFTQSGGTNIANSFIIASGAAGTYTMSGGTLTAASTNNNGTFSQSGGSASLGPLSGNGLLIIGGGAGTASASAAQLTQGTIAINNNGLLSILPNSHFDNSVNALSFTGNGQLDLANNHLFINYAGSSDPIASIVAAIKTGYASAIWVGPGIISTTAQANSAHYGLGYIDSAKPGNPGHLAASQIEIKYTLLGDTNLDGTVNALDFNALATNYGKSSKNWSDGDFTYDGTVTSNDFAALAANYGQVLPTSADLPDSATALGAIVPEPTSLAILSLFAATISPRRSRRK